MAPERWFYAQNRQRRGPVPLGELVESVLTQREPRSVLVWRKGLPGWTPAEGIPEVEGWIAPVLARRKAEAAERRAPVDAQAPPPPRVPQGANPLFLYGGLATGVVVTGLVAWLLWPRPETAGPQPQAVPLGGTTTENAPAVVIPAPASTPEATTTPASAVRPAPTPSVAAATPGPIGVGDEEMDLPTSELRKLRQVAAWSGTRLKLTVVNNTDWRVTELSATVQRFVGNEVVDDDQPILLLPPDAAVNDDVASLLSKVAPDRRKPGVNPLDTGTFSGEAGPRPDGFRCDIVSARGYAPR